MNGNRNDKVVTVIILFAVLAVIIAAVLFSVYNASRPAVWTTFTSAEGRFSVSFPGECKQESVKANTEFVEHKFMCEKSRGRLYWVMYCDYPPQVIRNVGPDKIINSIAAGTAANCKCSIIAANNMAQSAGHRGWEYQMLKMKSVRKPHACVRSFVVNNRVYVVLATGYGTGYDADACKFLDSFKIN